MRYMIILSLLCLTSYSGLNGIGNKLFPSKDYSQNGCKEQPALTIPPSAKVSTRIYPTNLAEYYQGRWLDTYFVLREQIGQKFGIYMNINGKGSLVQFEVCDH